MLKLIKAFLQACTSLLQFTPEPTPIKKPPDTTKHTITASPLVTAADIERIFGQMDLYPLEIRVLAQEFVLSHRDRTAKLTEDDVIVWLERAFNAGIDHQRRRVKK